jgi:hypoxanthine phosphoribosyltransferase
VKSYDYAHRQGVHSLTWVDIVALAGQIAEALEREGVEMVVGIARAGLIPATLIACSLRKEMYPVRLSRRVNDEVRYDSPVWRVPVSPDIKGKVVAIVDEIADTGETLEEVRTRVSELGAARVVTACLVSHSWAAPAPQIVSLVSDEFVIFPWDQQVLIDGQWEPHPEIAAALKLQPNNHQDN